MTMAIVPLSILTEEQREQIKQIDKDMVHGEDDAAKASLEGQIDEAADDLDYMRNVARRLDDAISQVDAAQLRLNTLAAAFLKAHDNLGLTPMVREFFQTCAWEKAMEVHVRNGSKSQFSIAKTIPGISETLIGETGECFFTNLLAE